MEKTKNLTLAIMFIFALIIMVMAPRSFASSKVANQDTTIEASADNSSSQTSIVKLGDDTDEPAPDCDEDEEDCEPEGDDGGDDSPDGE